jgi:hypothetical protein
MGEYVGGLFFWYLILWTKTNLSGADLNSRRLARRVKPRMGFIKDTRPEGRKTYLCDSTIRMKKLILALRDE